tara:strand:- start:791 stop:1600 length:810 start_codon:yes stop_codon:yes gene_type:complete
MFKKKDTKLLVENWRRFISEVRETRPSIEDYISAELIEKEDDELYLVWSSKAFQKHVDRLVSSGLMSRDTIKMFVEDLLDKKIPIHDLNDPINLRIIKGYAEAFGMEEDQRYLNFFENSVSKRSEVNPHEVLDQVRKNIEAEEKEKHRKDFLDKYSYVPESVVLRIEDLIEKRELSDLWYREYNLNDFYHDWSENEWKDNFYNFLKDCLDVDLKKMFPDHYDLEIRYYGRIDEIMRDCFSTVSTQDFLFNRTAKEFLLDFLNYIYFFIN